MPLHYIDVIMGALACQITGLMIVYSTVYSGADQRKHQSPASLAFVRGIHQWPVNSPHRASNAENVSIWWRHHELEKSVPQRLVWNVFHRRRISILMVKIVLVWWLRRWWLSVDIFWELNLELLAFVCWFIKLKVNLQGRLKLSHCW